MTFPVMKEAFSLTRNSITEATSSGLPNLFIKMLFFHDSNNCGFFFFVSSAEGRVNGPGGDKVPLIPYSAKSLALALVKVTTPAKDRARNFFHFQIGAGIFLNFRLYR